MVPKKNFPVLRKGSGKRKTTRNKNVRKNNPSSNILDFQNVPLDNISAGTGEDAVEFNYGFDLRRSLFADCKNVTLQSRVFTSVSFDRLIPPQT